MHRKEQRGNIFKLLQSCIFVTIIVIFFAQSANAYQTALITYPDYNKNWKQIYFGRQDDETISQWIPSYEYQNSWTESVVFHSYNWAKGGNCYRFMSNLLSNVSSQNPKIVSQIIKDRPEDSVAIWCAPKNATMPEQCEILRVTKAYESIVSIHYINKNRAAFMNYQKDTWLSIIRNVRIYYSYFRWDRVNGKETSVQLQ